MLPGEPENPPLHPEELLATLFMVADIRDEVIRIRRLLEEDDDGEEAPEADDA